MWIFILALFLEAMDFLHQCLHQYFALARTVGWISHWIEMHSDPDKKIGRPRQLYTGNLEKPFVLIKDR